MLCNLCSIGNIVIIISYYGRPARWITAFWQSAYRLHLYSHYIFSWQINTAAAAPRRDSGNYLSVLLTVQKG